MPTLHPPTVIRAGDRPFRSGCHDQRAPSLLRVLAWLVAAVLVVSSVVLTRPQTAAAAPAGAPRVTLIGDSTMLAMSAYNAPTDPRAIISATWDLEFQAASCRRLVSPSCGRTMPPVSTLPLMRTTLLGRMGEALVIMAGYDDVSIAGAVDQIMAEATRQGVRRVLWLDYPTSTPYVLPGGTPARDLYSSHNTELADAATRHANLVVLPWDQYTDDYPSWFTADGIHLNRNGALGLAAYIAAALDDEPAIGRCLASKQIVGDPESDVVVTPTPSGSYGFVAVDPVRVLDTRGEGMDGGDGMLGGDRVVEVDVSSVVPDDAVAAVLTVTAVDSCQPGYLTVYACGGRPETSNVNSEVGRNTAGMVIAPLLEGRFCIYALNRLDVVVDVTGAFTPDGQRFTPITPTRFVDTRSGTTLQPAVRGVKVGGTETQIQVAGLGGVPVGATAAWVNLTIADPTLSTVLGIYPGPCDNSSSTSSVNARPSRSTASAVLVGLGPNGSVCVRSVVGSSHIVLDVSGWFGPTAALRFFPQPAVRLLDTRGLSATASDIERQVDAQGVWVLNIAGTSSKVAGFVSLKPCGATAISSLVNIAPGEVIANVGVVAGGSGAKACVDPSTSMHLVVDRVARFAD